MTDPRIELQAAYGHWLRVRAKVRVLATSLIAAEYALQRDARRSDDRDLATLAMQVASERRAIEALGCELDARIAEVKHDRAAIESGHIARIVAAAHGEGRVTSERR